MQYQVIARPCPPSAGKWDYYPHLAPGRDKSAAERLARHAAQSGHEAVVLRSVAMEMLVTIARAIVERQDEGLLPALRFLPSEGAGMRGPQLKLEGDQGVIAPAILDPYCEGPAKVAFDARRSFIEMGPGGDVDADGKWRGQRPSFPQRMDVLGTWLRLRERVVQGKLGGATDGTCAVDVEDAS